jgi:hypothetical protein
VEPILVVCVWSLVMLFHLVHLLKMRCGGCLICICIDWLSTSFLLFICVLNGVGQPEYSGCPPLIYWWLYNYNELIAFPNSDLFYLLTNRVHILANLFQTPEHNRKGIWPWPRFWPFCYIGIWPRKCDRKINGHPSGVVEKKRLEQIR